MKLLPGSRHFTVDEEPAYAPSGDGEHLYVHIEKEGVTTDQVAEALARACGVRHDAVGYAGRKDRHAITRQWFSVHLPGQTVDPTRLADLPVPGEGRIAVLTTARHRNKLRLGHLAGNVFRLGLGEVDAAARARLEQALATLVREGIRNRFGPQRFGVGGATLLLARALGVGDAAAAVAAIIAPTGGWQVGDPLPEGWRPGPEGRVLGALRRRPDDPAGALRVAGEPLRKLAASAAQAAVFNAVLDARVAGGLLHRLRAGDLACTVRGAPFTIAEADVDDCNRRAAPGVLDCIATAPLPGTSRLRPAPAIDAEERAWSAGTGVNWSWFAERAPLESPGERRPLLVRFRAEPRLESEGEVCWLSLALPPGAYATEVLAQCGVTVPEDRRG